MAASWGVSAGFVATVVVVAALLPIAVAKAGGPTARRDAAIAAVGVAAWIALTGALAGSGALMDWSAFPPAPIRPILLAVVVVTALTAAPLGARLAGLPIAALVGFQVFRVPVELALWRLYVEGVIPVQMSFEGSNFDVLTGATAPVVAALAARRALPRWALAAWNTAGLALLLRIVWIAVRSAPGPLRTWDGVPNTLPGQLPFVWLPTVLVVAAWWGHLLVYRRLLADAGAGRAVSA